MEKLLGYLSNLLKQNDIKIQYKKVNGRELWLIRLVSDNNIEIDRW